MVLMKVESTMDPSLALSMDLIVWTVLKWVLPRASLGTNAVMIFFSFLNQALLTLFEYSSILSWFLM